MATNELLEVVKIFGLITVVWFAVVGWKLIPPPAKQSLEMGPEFSDPSPNP